MVFGEGILDRLPSHSVLHNENNPFRKVFINSIGALLDDFDLYDSMESPYLQNATDVYLDLHGKDLGVQRKYGESDEHYRNRLIYESLGYLTLKYLQSVYDLQLYVFSDNFNVKNNVLTSDNSYIGKDFMTIVNYDIRDILNRKFPINSGLLWIRENGRVDEIIIGGDNKVVEYINIYSMRNLIRYFKDNTGITSVYLDLPSATICYAIFNGCSSLTSADLNVPSAYNCSFMFFNCTALTDVTLNAPNLSNYYGIFYNCPYLESINVTIPADKVTGFKSYVLGLSLSNLTSFIINGEEVIE